jgi:Glycosyl hydrolase family 99
MCTSILYGSITSLICLRQLLGHSNDFHSGEEYLRDYLVPRQEPSMGEYDDRKPEVIREHLRMSRQANCRVWIASWFGPGGLEDTTLINNILPTVQASDPDHRIAIHYETNARIRKRDDTDLFKLDGELGKPSATHYYSVDGKPGTPNDGVIDDMAHFCNKYFNHPNYYYIGGRPVIFIYLSRTLTKGGLAGLKENGEDFYWNEFELLQKVVSDMRTGAMSKCGKDPYIVGDHIFDVFNAAEDGPAMEILDAITG